MTRVAVVGHVEWVDFVPVEHFPAPGEILHAHDSFARAGGGGSVVAVALARLGAEVDFFCALGDDRLGHDADERLRGHGVHTHVAWREEPTRRAVTLLDDGGERTIITLGERLAAAGVSDQLEWSRLRRCRRRVLHRGRRRRARACPPGPDRGRLAAGSSCAGAGRRRRSTRSSTAPATRGRASGRAASRPACGCCSPPRAAAGGRWWGESEGRWEAVAPPGEPRDAYGCGDSFAAGVAFGLAEGVSVAEAAALGARCGARCLTEAGPGA